MEAGFEEEFEFFDEAEAEDLVDEARIRAGRDQAAEVLVVVDEGHPFDVGVAPRDLVFARPVAHVGAVFIGRGLEELPQGGGGVVGVPFGGAHAGGIAGADVDVEGRAQCGAEFEEFAKRLLPGVAAAFGGLQPQVGALAEALGFAVVVVVGGYVLEGAVAEHRFGDAVPVFDAVQSPPRRGQRIDLRGPALVVVAGGAQPASSGGFDGGPENGGGGAEEFHAVRTAVRDLVDPGGRLVGGDRGGPVEGSGAQGGVDVQAWGCDLVGLGAAGFVDGPVEAVEGAEFADGGHAVAEPELEDVVGVRGLVGFADVGVGVDESGHDVGAVEVHDFCAVGRGAFGEAACPVGFPDSGDPVTFDENLRRPVGCGSGAVDDHGIAEDEPGVRSRSGAPVGGGDLASGSERH